MEAFALLASKIPFVEFGELLPLIPTTNYQYSFPAFLNEAT